jgi:hypothetical protein
LVIRPELGRGTLCAFGRRLGDFRSETEALNILSDPISRGLNVSFELVELCL